MSREGRSDERGFTLIEVMMATMVLTVGLLGLAGTTGVVVHQSRVADVTTERTMARRSAVEEIEALDLASVSAGSTTRGEFAIAWRVTASDLYSKTVQVVTTGPGLKTTFGSPRLTTSVADTITFQMIDLRP